MLCFTCPPTPVSIHESVLRLLIARGVPIDASSPIERDEDGDLDGGNTALHHAAQERHTVAIRILLEAGADPNRKTARQATPLIMLCSERLPDTACRTQSDATDATVAGMLCDAGADTEVVDDNGYTALACAAKEGHAPLITTLINRGARADVTAPPGSGMTPLHWCVYNAAQSGAGLAALGAAVRDLVSAGAPVSQRASSMSNLTPLAAAKRNCPGLLPFFREGLRAKS